MVFCCCLIKFREVKHLVRFIELKIHNQVEATHIFG